MIALALAATLASVALGFWLMHGWFASIVGRYRRLHTTQTRVGMEDIFLFIDAGQLWFANLVVCAVAGVAALALFGSVLAALGVAACMVRLPQRLIRAVRVRRLARFDAQLPDTLRLLASGLRAGASVTTALKHIVDQSEPPVSQEFSLMLREQRLGVTFADSLSNLCGRMPSEAANLTCAAMGIAARTGGNLSETLDRIADTLRRVQALRGKIRAMTAQGRMQAWVVASLPVALAMVLTQLSPNTMGALWSTPAGWCVAGLIVALEGVGIFWIRRIVDIDV